MCLYVYDPVITQILWPALTKFDRGVQTALSYKVPTHLHRNRSLGRKGGLRKHPAQGEVVVRSLKITGTKWDATWISYPQQSFAQISASITKHKSVESAGRGEGRLTELFGLLSLRNSRAWPQLQKAAERPGLKGGEEIPPSGLCRPRPLELLHGQSWPGQSKVLLPSQRAETVGRIYLPLHTELRSTCTNRQPVSSLASQEPAELKSTWQILLHLTCLLPKNAVTSI